MRMLLKDYLLLDKTIKIEVNILLILILVLLVTIFVLTYIKKQKDK